MKHFFKIGEGLDVMPAMLAIRRHPELWSKRQFRQRTKANSETECILLRYQCAPQQDLYRYNLSNMQDCEAAHLGLECHDLIEYSLLPEIRPIVRTIMDTVSAERLGRVLLAKLPPGKRVYPHDDGGLYVDYYTRVVVPIYSQPGNISRIGGEFQVMLPGEAWFYDYKTEHEAVNDSQDDRIHLFIDVRLPASNYIDELPE